MSLDFFNSNYAVAKTDKIESVKYRIGYFKEALSSFKRDNGQFPTTSEGLRALVVSPDKLSNWNGLYINYLSIPTDSWGSRYIYIHPAQHGGRDYDLYSVGPNKVDEYRNGDDISQGK